MGKSIERRGDQFEEGTIGGITIIDKTDGNGVDAGKIKAEVKEEFINENNGKKRKLKKKSDTPESKHEQKGDPENQLKEINRKIEDAQLELQDAGVLSKNSKKILKKIDNLEKQKANLSKEDIVIKNKKDINKTKDSEITHASWFKERSKEDKERVNKSRENVKTVMKQQEAEAAATTKNTEPKVILTELTDNAEVKPARAGGSDVLPKQNKLVIMKGYGVTELNNDEELVTEENVDELDRRSNLNQEKERQIQEARGEKVKETVEIPKDESKIIAQKVFDQEEVEKIKLAEQKLAGLYNNEPTVSSNVSNLKNIDFKSEILPITPTTYEIDDGKLTVPDTVGQELLKGEQPVAETDSNDYSDLVRAELERREAKKENDEIKEEAEELARRLSPELQQEFLEKNEEVMKNQDALTIEAQVKENAQLKEILKVEQLKTAEASIKAKEFKDELGVMTANIDEVAKKYEGNDLGFWDRIKKSPKAKTAIACVLLGSTYAVGALALGATGPAAVPLYSLGASLLAKMGITIAVPYMGGGSTIAIAGGIGKAMYWFGEKTGMIKDEKDGEKLLKEFLDKTKKSDNTAVDGVVKSEGQKLGENSPEKQQENAGEIDTNEVINLFRANDTNLINKYRNNPELLEQTITAVAKKGTIWGYSFNKDVRDANKTVDWLANMRKKIKEEKGKIKDNGQFSQGTNEQKPVQPVTETVTTPVENSESEEKATKKQLEEFKEKIVKRFEEFYGKPNNTAIMADIYNRLDMINTVEEGKATNDLIHAEIEKYKKDYAVKGLAEMKKNNKIKFNDLEGILDHYSKSEEAVGGLFDQGMFDDKFKGTGIKYEDVKDIKMMDFMAAMKELYDAVKAEKAAESTGEGAEKEKTAEAEKPLDLFGDLENKDIIDEVVTAKGSVYKYLEDGRTQRYKKAEKEGVEKNKEPQDMLVYIPDFEWIKKNASKEILETITEEYGHPLGFEQTLLHYVHDKGKGISISGRNGEVFSNNSEIAAYKDQIYLNFGEKGKTHFSIPVSRKPKVGFSTFDTRAFKKDETIRTEKHIGNKVVEIKTK